MCPSQLASRTEQPYDIILGALHYTGQRRMNHNGEDLWHWKPSEVKLTKRVSRQEA